MWVQSVVGELKFSNVENELKELGMAKAKFSVNFNDFPTLENFGDSFDANGVDSVEFMFSAKRYICQAMSPTII